MGDAENDRIIGVAIFFHLHKSKEDGIIGNDCANAAAQSTCAVVRTLIIVKL
jgi:hypothetical protein